MPSGDVTSLDAFLKSRDGSSFQIVAFLGMAITLGGIAALSFIEIDQVQTFSGRVVASGKNKTVQALQQGEVKKIFVADGAVVRVGDVIATLDSTVSTAVIDRLQHQQFKQSATQERLSAQIQDARPMFNEYPDAIAASEKELWVAETRAYTDQERELKKQVAQKDLGIQIARSSQARAQGEYDNAAKQEELVREGVGVAISQFSYLGYQNSKNKTGLDLEIQSGNLAQAVNELKIAKNKLLEFQSKHSEDLLKQKNQIVMELRNTELELIKEKRKAISTAIISPADGVIDRLKLTTVGQALNAGDVVASIVPQDNKLVMRAEASTKDIARVAEGAVTHIKVDAYPYQTFGAISGVVTWISADSEEDASGRESTGRHYVLESSIENWELGNHGNVLKPGMSATIDVTTEKKSLMSIIFSPALKNFNQALQRQ